MAKSTYQPLGPLLSGDGSRAFLGLEIKPDATPRPVVLVWVPDETAKDAQLAAKVARETERASALAHPNVLKVHGLVALDEGLARVVEFADGEPLRKILDAAKKLPPRLAALVAADAAMGVHYAHVAGQQEGAPYLHGDIRPETLMVSFSGVCKVAGYGALGVAPKEPGGRRFPGRRWHCAPEQIVGGREAVNRQTDVYLLGLVLYESLSGRIPFEGEASFDDAVLNRPFPALLPEDVPAPLIRVVEQATAKKAYHRYPTARALRDAIERAVGVLPAHEEMAIFLRRFFPEDAPARTARRREIETGISELSRRVEPIVSQLPEKASEPARATVSNARSLRVFGAVLLLAAVVFGVWYAGEGNHPAPEIGGGTAAKGKPAQVPAISAPATSKEAPPASAQVLDSTPSACTDQQTQAPKVVPPELEANAAEPAPAATANSAGIEPSVAKEPAATIEVVAAKASSAPAEVAAAKASSVRNNATAASLNLTVDPPVEVRIDGRVVGRSPVSVVVLPGTHSLQLIDASRGINVSRSIRLAAAHRSTQRLVIGKGTVEVSAPDGALIFIDGRPVGTAPLGDLAVYEGKHRILAKLGGAKWQQTFSVGANERMTFKIETVEQ